MLAVTPAYAAVGLWAPVISVLGRLICGLSIGAELAASTTFLVASAPRGHCCALVVPDVSTPSASCWPPAWRPCWPHGSATRILRREAGASASGWEALSVSTISLPFFGLVQPLVGHLSDRVGRGRCCSPSRSFSAIGVVLGLALVRSAGSFGALLRSACWACRCWPKHPGLFGRWAAVLAAVTFVVVLVALPETAHDESAEPAQPGSAGKSVKWANRSSGTIARKSR